jgi:WXG100 family type VII secretion target
MPYTVSQIAGSDPESLLGAASRMNDAAATVGAQIAREQSQFDTLRSDWTGTAADAAQKQGGEMRTDQSAYAQRLRDVAKPLSTGGRKLADIRSQLQKAVDAAEDQWDVADDGSVTVEQYGLEIARERITDKRNPFETNAGASDGGYS